MKLRIVMAAAAIGAAALVGVGQAAPAMADNSSCANAQAQTRSDLQAAGRGGTSSDSPSQLTNNAESYIFTHGGNHSGFGSTQLKGDVNQLNAYCR